MGLADGDLFVSGSILSYQQANRIYQNFRGATVPSALQPGALWSDSDDDKIHHRGASAVEEILQLTRSSDVNPTFTKVYLDAGIAKESPHKTTGSWSKSVGSGGDYADWATMIADMPDLIAHAVTVTIKKGTTLTETCNVKNKHGVTSIAKISITTEEYFPQAGVIPIASSATATTLVDNTQSWATDRFIDCWVFIVHGTGTDNGFTKITDSDGTSVTVASWSGTEPDNTSRYIIVGALISGGGTRSECLDIRDCSLSVNFYGIGFYQADRYGLWTQRCSYVQTNWCGFYDCDRGGVNALYGKRISVEYCGIVKCNTDNHTSHAGVTGAYCQHLGVLLCGISDNNQRGVFISNGTFAVVSDNFGDGNGDWGTYAEYSAQASINGVECSGTSGNHSDPGTAGDNNADQASAY